MGFLLSGQLFDQKGRILIHRNSSLFPAPGRGFAIARAEQLRMNLQEPHFLSYSPQCLYCDKPSFMTNPLNDSELEYLLRFIGYGTLDADVWFLGMEEAGGGEENIRTRLNFRPVEDNAEAHKMLGVTHLHWGKRKIQRAWRGMCYIMLRLEDQEPTRENTRTYQAEKLGRFGGNTLLTELMPIPKPKVKRWDYEELIPQFASREEYYRVVKPRRIRNLRALLTEHRPKVVVCYGKAFWGD
jgi:hypothetical protein